MYVYMYICIYTYYKYITRSRVTETLEPGRLAGRAIIIIINVIIISVIIIIIISTNWYNQLMNN